MRARAVLVALLASASAAFAARAPAPAPQLPSLPPDVDFVPLPTPVATAVAAAQAADAARDAVAAGKALSAAPSNWTAAGGRLNSTGAVSFALAAGGRDGAPLLAVAPPGDGGRVHLLRLDGDAWADAAAPLDPPPGGGLAALAAAADGRVYLAFGGEAPRGANSTLPALYATDAAGPTAAWTRVASPGPAPSKPAPRRARDAPLRAGADAPDAVPARDAALATDGADVYLVTAYADRGSGVSAARLNGGADAARKGKPSLEDLEPPAKGATASRVRAAAGGGVLAVAYGDVPGNKVVVRWREVRGGGTSGNATAAKGGARDGQAKPATAWRDACGGSLPESADQLVNPVAVGGDGTIYVATNPYVEDDPLRQRRLPHNVWACGPRGGGAWRPLFNASVGVPSPTPAASVLVSSLAVAPDGGLVIAFDGGPGGPYVFKLADGAWASWGGLFGGARARPSYDDYFQTPFVALTPDGVPVVAAASALVTEAGDAVVAVRRCEACAAAGAAAAAAAAPTPPEAPLAPAPAPAARG
jgi:hypothetical protein